MANIDDDIAHNFSYKKFTHAYIVKKPILMGELNLFIYVVQTGDSLFSISSKYNVPIDEIRMANGLEMTNFVPGQALVIPTSVYTVQPGDSFFTIANMALVSLEQLRVANPSINPNALQSGMKITIPNIANYPAIIFNYYVIRTPELDRFIINDFAPYSSFIALFDYQFNPSGNIVNDLNDQAAIEEAWRNHVVPLVTITNLVPEGFSTDLTRQVLNNPSARINLINNIVNLISRKGYGGVNIDFEQVAAEDRDLLTGFLLELKTRLEGQGYWLTIAVPPKTSDDIPWLRGYDYGGIGAIVDLMFIMTYDWHHTASEPGPVAPINEVRNTINFAVERVPREKIILGIPQYGYNWTIPHTLGSTVTAMSIESIVNIAMRHEATIQYSEQYASPFFRYVDDTGQMHEIWFEDARSISEKMKLVREFNIAGTGAWQLTLGFPQGPWISTTFFQVKRV